MKRKKEDDIEEAVELLNTGPKVKFSRRVKVSVGVIIALIIGFVFLLLSTGFLQIGNIDERDLVRWERNDDGVIVGAEEFAVPGDKDVCWMLVHGYTSTPNEFRGLAGNISEEFGDYIVVPRLKGHGELPSHVLNLSLDDWYEQIEKIYVDLNEECGEVNLVGSSFGGALSTRIAEEHDVGRLYLMDTYFQPTYRKKWILPMNAVISSTAELFNYVKKDQKLGQINDPEGASKYITYYNFPLEPVKNSRGFLDDTRSRVDEIDEPTLVIHSPRDQTASYSEMEEVYAELNVDKEFLSTERSNHIILLDYDKDLAINKILEFEGERR